MLGIISLLITDKWLPAALYLRIFCITYAFYPIHTANLNAIKALGRSDLYMKLEICKKAVGLVLLLVSMWISVEAMAYVLSRIWLPYDVLRFRYPSLTGKRALLPLYELRRWGALFFRRQSEAACKRAENELRHNRRR